jgi:hypothetical protein
MFVLFILTMVGCAAGPNSAVDSVAGDGSVAGFWLGLWHGLISPIAFLFSLFEKSVGIYEIHNNGAWYNLGFILGVSATFGGSGKAS